MIYLLNTSRIEEGYVWHSCFRYRALYNYVPQNDDEVELKEGDIVYVMEKCDDGWFVGTSQRTGIFGTFPGNYVSKAWNSISQILDQNQNAFNIDLCFLILGIWNYEEIVCKSPYFFLSFILWCWYKSSLPKLKNYKIVMIYQSHL